MMYEPPSQSHSPTSVAAGEAIKPHIGRPCCNAA